MSERALTCSPFLDARSACSFYSALRLQCDAQTPCRNSFRKRKYPFHHTSHNAWFHARGKMFDLGMQQGSKANHAINNLQMCVRGPPLRFSYATDSPSLSLSLSFDESRR